jgi:hypothetical protein
MQIIVNHLTRMRTGDRICIAGIDLEGTCHVRPVTPQTDLLTRDLLVENGGPIDLAAVVDIGQPQPVASRPETEDHLVATRDLKRVKALDGDDYLDLLDAAAEPDLEAAFGPDLQRQEWKYAVDEGEGHASLAVIKARSRPELEVDRYGKVQLRFNDPNRPTFLSVADIRFVEADHTTVRTDVVDDVHARLQRGVGVYVMFGLSRAFTASNDDQSRHWLQVNGLCLEDRPVGEVP